MKLLDRLEKVIEEGNLLKEALRKFLIADDKYREELAQNLTKWTMSCNNFFDFASLPSFGKQFTSIEHEGNPYSPYTIGQLVGVLESARDEINSGFVSKLKYIMHADIFESTVDQAESLLQTGHSIPAAVLGRIIIEEWIKDEAEKAGIAYTLSDKAAVINDRLKNGGVFSTPKWRQIQSLLDVGNSAAHGRTSEFSEDDVKRMIDFIRSNCF